MSTSGQSSYNPTRDVIVDRALRILRAYPIYSSPHAVQVTNALTALNMMLKSWQTQGLLWLREKITVFPTSGTTRYLLPGARVAADITETTLTSLAGTALVVASTDGMMAADFIGIVLDDNTLHWDTIASVTDGTSLVLTTGTSSSASAGNAVYVYTTAFGRPPRVYGAYRLQADGTEVMLNALHRSDYLQKTNKRSTGTPVEWHYDAQLAAGELFLYPAPTDERIRVLLDVDRVIEDMLSDQNNFDAPQHWIEAIAYGLADRLTDEYGTPMAERQLINQRFSAARDNALNYDREPVSTFFQPEYC